MPTLACKTCKKSFYAKPFWIKRGFGKYCSSNCQHLGRRNGEMVPCSVCGKKVYRPLRRLSISKSKKFFCNKSCQTKWRNQEFVGNKHVNWKEGKFAYRTVLLRNQVLPICAKCRSKDERVMETHHLDKNRSNNNISNLIWLCRNCHFLVHHYKEEALKLTKNVAVCKLRSRCR
jgi:hypothetical protein